MAATAAARPYHIVVWGATGFTGRLVCEHAARDYQGRVRWAMAGRDSRKLEALREELGRINPAVKDVPILVADAQDSEALGRVVAQTQVVLALAGPFAKYGSGVVAAAARHGTHYCDITGEIPWVKRSMAANDAAARASGAKIVHCCGYDSVPSDLGVLMMADHVRRTYGKGLAQAYTLVQGGKGGVSGGTIASAFNIANEPDLAQLGSNTYYLADTVPGAKHGSDRPAPFLPTFHPAAGVWAGPFIMEGCNAKIVHLSNALTPPGPYGKDFKYCEAMEGGVGWGGFAKAAAVSLFGALAGASLALPPARALLKRVLPAPGQGPDEEARRTGHWTHRLVVVTEEEPGAAPTVVEGVCSDRRDPGYSSTSRMILELGLALALDAEAIAASGACSPAGVMTPAAAAGMVLVERLRKAGFTWQVKGPVSGPLRGA